MQRQQITIRDKDEYKIIEKRYYGLAESTPLFSESNHFDDPICRRHIHLCACAREGCPNMEVICEEQGTRLPTPQELVNGITSVDETKNMIDRFPRCPICMTKYCSKECQIHDWKHGHHREKCKKFKYVKDQYEKGLCPDCWTSKWSVLSDFFPCGKKSVEPYKPCKKCLSSDILIQDNLPDDIAFDPDIQRVWLQ